MSRKASIITGATGQDGSYLCELLLEKGYDVKCLVRRSTYDIETGNLKPVLNRIQLYEGDILDQPVVHKIINDCGEYDRIEIYNLAAQSHVHTSFRCPSYTFETNTTGILNILESVRQSSDPSKYRVYQASTSEMFGKVRETPQTEETPFYPRSVYGVSKLAAHWLVKNYRESYGMYACSGILFNHESPRRGADFVTKKITDGVKQIVKGEREFLELGNLNAARDWGHAKDYVEAMWLMLQQEEADEYVVATGETHSVRQFVEMCFKEVGKEITWEGAAEKEVGLVDGKVVIKVSPKFYRPCEVDALIGNASKIKNIGWVQKNTVHDLIKDMMTS
ncbi:GDP-mannose 4,6-dehydratase [Ostreococcus lucimarinus virus OlV6]|jgi:GDPmannose 4,6-dehydratase|uniref:nucleotide-sugar epimerase n=1 Tax=Ostreococcus lucimarinus virus OlV5 TaxID=754064 RepID=UPI00026335F9|nr:nucleotide-sugar epimerase [Ostreococcus lucimarinus virus OlV5]AFK65996.1 GDP-mannose 4,6-dehydratase [Ostreococcus lucimarinus virus OlV6]AGH31318.1 GDP-mannose 4,6-dehydratase [Ostreococcus lucimarinus virus OlV5]